MEARIREASSDTVRYARMVLSAADLCGRIRFALVLATAAALLIQTGVAYSNWLSTTELSSFLFH